MKNSANILYRIVKQDFLEKNCIAFTDYMALWML